MQCAANGTAIRDSVIFSIPDNSLSGRTITLLSALPALSSNMVINGVSQGGAPIGVSQAQVMLFLPVYSGNFTFLQLSDCNDVGIYGLAFITNYTTTNNYFVYGISYVRCHNLQIGRPGAGNYMLGCSYSIYSNTGAYGFYVPADSSRLLTIQSNVIGLDMNGGFSNTYQSLPVPMMWKSLQIIKTSDILIGGDDPAEGNTIVFGYTYPGYSFTGINFLIETDRNQDNGILKIKNNRLGTRTDGTLDPNYTSVPVLIFISGAESDYDFQFTNNILQGQINVNSIGKYFTIQGNTIFSPRINTIYDCAITVSQDNGGGLIGGDLPGQSNTIYNVYFDTLYYFEDNYYEAAIRFDLQSHVTIRNNITTCNSYHSSGYTDTENDGRIFNYAWVRIDSTGQNFVKGKATPNTRIDLYLDDDCLACEGKSYLGFTMSKSDSSWQYTSVFNSTVVATSTSISTGQTSAFSAPEILDWYLKIKNPTCGEHNGYIKGLQVSGGDHYKWHYMYKVNGNWRDSVVATTIDLVNAGPGLYFFDAWLGQTCRSYFKQYQLYDQTPKLDTTHIAINMPGCGKFNGSITNISLSSYQDIRITWVNENNIVVGNQPDLLNAGPGKYKLIIKDTTGTCADSTFYYTLVNLTGPSVNINNAQITSATCHSANGGITNIQFSSVTGTAVYYWYDSKDRLIINNPDLTNVPAGSYYLKFKDQGTCDTITTPVFVIPGSGVILFDTSAKVITASKCLATTGGISNINVTNASSYQWVDTVMRTIVSLAKDLTNVQPGYYKLIGGNALGCSDSTATYFVPRASAGKLTVSSIKLKQESCNRSDGYAEVTSLNPSATGFTFSWTDSTTIQVISNGLNVENISAGKYFLYATDTNNCRQLVTTVSLKNLPAPAINMGSAIVQPDACNLTNGSVSGIDIQGSSPFSYSWYNNTNQFMHSGNDLTNAPAGDYYMVVKDANGCVDSSGHFQIGDTSLLIQPPIYKDLIVLKGTPAELDVSNPETGSYALFETGIASFPKEENTTGHFVTGPLTADTTMYISLQEGTCISGMTAVNIKVVETLYITMPNAFTPNFDGHNDIFRLKYPSLVKTFHMTIFDRWGQKVFETSDAAKGWDGNINSVMQPVGNYVYFISYTDLLGGSKTLSGNVMLIR
jgi:gliding motility-associated-like protein